MNTELTASPGTLPRSAGGRSHSSPAPDPGVVQGSNWPVPPFLSIVDSGDAAFQSATVLTRHASRRDGHFVRLMPSARVVQFNPAGATCNTDLSYDDIEIMSLIDPVDFAWQLDLIASLGADPRQIARARPYRLEFFSGDHMQGTAVSARVQDGSLFLFEELSFGRALRHFIPLSCLRTYQVGEDLGELLVAQHGVSPDRVAGAQRHVEAGGPKSLDAVIGEMRILSRYDLEQVLDHNGAVPLRPLGEVLLDLKMITAPQLERALAGQKTSQSRQLGQTLVEMGVISEEKLKRALQAKLGIPFVDLYVVPPDPAAVRMLDVKIATRFQAIPLLLHAGALVVAVADPLDQAVLEAVRFACGQTVIPVIATASQVRDCILRCYDGIAAGTLGGTSAPAQLDEIPYSGQADDQGIDALAGQLAAEGAARLLPVDARPVSESDTTLVRFVNTMILDAYRQDASDIHVESYPDRQSSCVRFRRDGVLGLYIQVPSGFRQALVARLKIMADLDISEHRRGQDGKIMFSKFGPANIELRVAVVPVSGGLEDVVMRILASGKPVPIDALGIDPVRLEELKALMLKPHGMILACGPTGSGKTTTLHSLLSYINTPDRKIWTAEDPVEITQPGLRQVQVNPKIGWDFAATLRSFLRADPDVIMVGEMRDAETARIAIEASLTGHLLLSTLHTNGAIESVARLLEMGMDRFNFADALLGLVAQRLARRLCRTCARPRQLSPDELGAMAHEYASVADQDAAAVLGQWRDRFSAAGGPKVYLPVGCKVCEGSGYKGRIGLYEILHATEAFKRLVRANASSEQLRRQALADGMVLLRQDGIEKVLQGLTTMEQVRAAAG